MPGYLYFLIQNNSSNGNHLTQSSVHHFVVSYNYLENILSKIKTYHNEQNLSFYLNLLYKCENRQK
jgi:hypothetical protein